MVAAGGYPPTNMRKRIIEKLNVRKSLFLGIAVLASVFASGIKRSSSPAPTTPHDDGHVTPSGVAKNTDSASSLPASGTKVAAKFHPQAPVDYNHPPRQYAAYRRQGWEVLVESQLADEDALTLQAVLDRVDQKLGELAALLPPATLPDLRKLKIFILYGTQARAGGRGSGLEYFRADAPGYHDWLDPRMGRSIVIYDAANYLRLSEVWALKSLVHEFGHAQHLEHWPEDYADIRGAWANAMKAGRYQVVRAEDKDTHVPNYAAQNHLEYFAELSAMYFGGANYFPGDRAGLKTYDPEGYAMIRKLWGIDAPPPPRALSDGDP